MINMNDIIDNRIEKNLRTISKMQLVDLPSATIELEGKCFENRKKKL